jgi:hypothetical protein
MSDDEKYIAGKRSDRIYFSKEFPAGTRVARYVSRVTDSAEREHFTVVNKEVVLRTTATGKQQVKALFYLDNREIRTLTLQRFSTDPDHPHEQAYITLKGDEISRLLDLALLIETATFEGQRKVRLDLGDLENFRLTSDAVRALLATDPKLLVKLAENEIVDRDIVAIGYRRKELEYFNRLLTEPAFFTQEKESMLLLRDEQLWQGFFERNSWIFGYGFFYVFTSALDERKLEQIVSGASISGSGKRADALLRTRGRISSLCFAEIKTHTTSLLEEIQYRSDVWVPSKEVVGAIAQIHKTVDRAENTIGRRLDLRSPEGNPTGESAFLIRPRSIVVVGNLAQFKTELGVNESKYTSFELFRRQLFSPEIITFDELYDRARFIVELAKKEEV